jgi:hypothetical protein
MSLIARASDKTKLRNGNWRMKITITSTGDKIPVGAKGAKYRAQIRGLAEAGIVSEATRKHLPLARKRVNVIEEESSGEFARMFAEEMVFTIEVES